MSKPSFELMKLKKELVDGILAYGVDEPSMFQQQAISAILTGKDTICQAEFGTGVAAFAIAALQQINENIESIQILVVSPTHELALKSQAVVTSIGQRMNFKSHCFVDGEVSDNIQNGVKIAFGTPKSIAHIITNLECNQIKTIIIDEANEIQQCLIEQLVHIFKCTPKNAQIVLVSTTISFLPKEVLKIISDTMKDPIKIFEKEDELTLDGIHQYKIDLKEEWKVETILDIFTVVPISNTVVFCNSINSVKALNASLIQKDFACAQIHSDMNHAERNNVMDQFRKGYHRILIATNAIAKGYDVQNVSLIINYDIPSPETYLHRIGRFGRFGRLGFATRLVINLVTEFEQDLLRKIKEHFKTKIDDMPTDLSNL
ncbi:Eukaryotic_translation initiation factor 4A [Hexamita inflata]|uniref:RNA helicase n=1 Tax=Hexamita inflata TaxID=28002 RepID=A0AA86RHI1_9EUKA|nr:Eukaryotic translation initiation factor 4A [Hexamita inflata]